MEQIREIIAQFVDASPRERAWHIVGFVGHILFFGRFFVQWIASEREGKVVIPLSFWIFSIVGGSTVLLYAIHLRNPVFTLGYTASLIIYIRNIILHLRHHEEKELI